MSGMGFGCLPSRCWCSIGRSRPLSTGGSLVAEVVPSAVFAMVGGSLADRVDRRRLMILCDMVRFAVMTAFTVAYALHVPTVPMTYGGLAIISISAAFFMGGQSASIPYLVGKEGATRATSSRPSSGARSSASFGPLPALAVRPRDHAAGATPF